MKHSFPNKKIVRFRRKSNFDSAGAILAKAFKKYGLEDKITKYKFVTNWPEIMGEAIAMRSRPEYIRNKTLYIRVADSAWVQELSFHKAVIIKKIQKFLDQDSEVSDVRFFVGNL